MSGQLSVPEAQHYYILCNNNKVQPLAHHKQNKFTTQTKHNKVQPFAQHEKKNKFMTQTKHMVNRHDKSTYFTYLMPLHHHPFVFYKTKNSTINHHISHK